MGLIDWYGRGPSTHPGSPHLGASDTRIARKIRGRHPADKSFGTDFIGFFAFPEIIRATVELEIRLKISAFYSRADCEATPRGRFELRGNVPGDAEFPCFTVIRASGSISISRVAGYQAHRSDSVQAATNEKTPAGAGAFGSGQGGIRTRGRGITPTPV